MHFSAQARLALIAGAAFCAPAHHAAAQSVAAYFLSPAGTDTASCTAAAPCATLAHAQSLMRATSTKITYLLSGTYALPAPLILTKADDGETFSAYPGQSPAVMPGAAGFSTPIFINNAEAVVISGLALSNTRAASDGGDCIQINGGSGNTLQQNQVGPCFGHGVHITGGNGHRVFDSYIHTDHRPSAVTCCDVNEGVRVEGHASNILIAGNVIAFSESNIELQNTSKITADGNFLLNPLGPFPRGQNLQANNSSSISVTRNYAMSSQDPAYPFHPDQEDSINFYYTTSPLAQGNYVTGGISPSGCAIIADAHTNGARFLGNTVFDSGECGIAISSGSNHTVSGNQILNLDPIKGGGNVAIYAANYAAPYPCATVTISRNIASAISSPCDPSTQSCTFNSFYQDGSCTGVKVTGNTFDEAEEPEGGGAAYKKLIATVPQSAPLIPPYPHACVAVSPYSTQTSMPMCQ